jgi:predicted Zn-dependent protease
MTPTSFALKPLLRIALRSGAVVLACGLFAAVPAWSQTQDAARALNLFQQLLQQPKQNNAPLPVNPALPVLPAQPVNPSQPLNPGGLLGNALTGGGNVNRAAGNAALAADLVGMLAQSTAQIDLPQELEIGRQLSAVLLGSKPLHPDMQLQRYVNQLGRWISLQSGRPDLPWTFAVLDDDGFNAFAAPGGYVFITKGLVDRVADESELAGILAHEISHVVRKHHLEAIGKNARAGLVTQLIGSQLNNNLGGALSAQLIGLGRNLYAKGLDQDDEYEADRLGVTLAAASGFDPYGLPAVLQQLRTAAADNPVFMLALSTHPPAQLRIDQLELAMGNRLDALSGKAAMGIPQRMGLLAMAQAPTPPAASNTGASKPPPATRLPAKANTSKARKP